MDPELRASALGAGVKLILGVLDVAYSDAHSGAKTTGDVAEILEKKYHPMETFYVARQEQIGNMLAESVVNAIETLVTTGRHVNPTFGGAQKIEAEFRAFLDKGEMAKLVAGLSEGESAAFNWKNTFDSAGKSGVSHRKKRPHSSKNKARVAFVDTGLYRSAFRAWLEE